MQVEIFAICDAATDYGGRLNLLGAFEGVAVPEVPFSRDRCSVALRLRCPADKAGRHEVQVQLVDPKGEPALAPMKAVLNIKPQPGRSSVSTNLVLNINGLRVTQFGEHQMVLSIDGETKMKLPLLIAQAKRRPPPSRMEN